MAGSKLAEAIVLTLFQASEFSYPLTRWQIWQRLLVSRRVSEGDFFLALEELKGVGLVCEQGAYLHLVYGKVELSGFRKRQRVSRQKRAQLNVLLKLLRKLRLVKAVAITGSVAINNAAEEDDIDFLIVTAAGVLYLVRAIVVFWSVLCGHKRSPGRNEQQRDQWCFNVWLSVGDLRLPRERQTLYSAYELLQADFVIDKDGVREKMWQANEDWVKGMLANAAIQVPNRVSHTKSEFCGSVRKRSGMRLIAETYQHKTLSGTRCGFQLVWLRLLSSILFRLQYLFMRRKMTREIVTREQAFFHPRPSRLMNKKDLIKQHQVFLGTLRGKAKLPPALLAAVARAHQNAQVVVLVTGVFDLLHTGHLEFLRQARQSGDVLLVGVESDERVRSLKGNLRPYHSELVRLGRVKQLNLAQQVFVLPENFGRPETREEVLRELVPDVLAVSMRSAHLAAKKSLTKKLGIELIMLGVNTRVSTTAILSGKVSAEQLLFSEDQKFVKVKNG